MKHRYVICLLIISLLVGMLCIPVSAKTVFDFDYTLDTVNGETFINVSIPLDDSLDSYYDWDDTSFSGPSCTFTIPGNAAEYATVYIRYQSEYIDFTYLPDSSTISASASYSCNKAHISPSASMFIEYNYGLITGEEESWYDTATVLGTAYHFASVGEPISLGSMTIERGAYGRDDAESFAVGVCLDNFMGLSLEDTTYTVTLTSFTVRFSLDEAYSQQIQTGITNQLLEDLKDSNKEISDKLDEIANALEPAPGAGEGAKEEAAVQGGQIDDLNNQMNELDKPDLSDQGSISDIISSSELTSYTTFLASMVNAPYISSVVMLALILSLAAYVLFGKRG
ncbi:MAG: hypothetical protein J6Q53_00685 [Oscillospiraceae bacterium]|nr:hypothetical protein [Oscillospiraceae bacterium]